MKLQDQVCTLEQAKRLKELGIEASSLFWYVQELTPTNSNLHYYGYSQESMPWDIFLGRRSTLSGSRIAFEYPAYTSAELGWLLPDEIVKDDYCYRLYHEKIMGAWFINYLASSETTEWGISDQSEMTSHIEAEVRAWMLIYLLENKLTTPEECNQRLIN